MKKCTALNHQGYIHFFSPAALAFHEIETENIDGLTDCKTVFELVEYRFLLRLDVKVPI